MQENGVQGQLNTLAQQEDSVLLDQSEEKSVMLVHSTMDQLPTSLNLVIDHHALQGITVLMASKGQTSVNRDISEKEEHKHHCQREFLELILTINDQREDTA